MSVKGMVHRALGLFDLRVGWLSSYQRVVAQAEGARQAAAAHDRLDAIKPILERSERLMRTLPAWYEAIASEPGVQIALRDLVKPGDVCFDVGGFQGDLTLVLSRLVGPRGLVCTFEANPATLPILTNNCIANALSNVYLTHAAVWHRTGNWVNILDPGPGLAAAAAVVAAETGHVETLALDDFVTRHRLTPAVVKMDIEGAEKHALRGFERCLTRDRPHLILEQFVGDDDAIRIVRDLGYRVFCTNQYTEIRSSLDFLPGTAIRNVACIHTDRLGETPYGRLGGREVVRVFRPAETATARPGAHSARLDLPAGRYLATLECSADPAAVLCFQSFTRRGLQGQYYEAFERFGPNCRDLPFDQPEPGPVILNVQEVGDCWPAVPANPTLRLNTLRVERVVGI